MICLADEFLCFLCREVESKMLKMMKTKEDMEAFYKERDAYKQKEKEEMEEENR